MSSNFSCEMTSFTNITYEDPCRIHSSCKIMGQFNIGAYSYLGENCLVGGAIIGRYCSIAPGVKIGLGEHEPNHISMHPIFFGSKHSFNIPDRIGTQRDLTLKKHQIPKIGHDVWIGANVVICRGVEIGNGAVIAAGSIVRENVESYSIVGGVPAKFIKLRFSKDIISELMELNWWDYELENFVGIDTSNVEGFIEIFKKKKKSKAKYNVYIRNSEKEILK